MNKFFQILGFCTGIILFIGLNFYSLNANYGGWDDFGAFGIPFLLMDSGWFLQRILWFGLIADILIAIIFSFILGFVFEFVWSKFHRVALN